MKKLNFYLIPVIIFLSFALFIGGSHLTGYWQTERSATPKVIETGSFQGGYDPYDIRGSYTIAEVLEFYPISKEEFYTGLGLPASMPTSTQLKEFESLAAEGEHFGVSNVRDFVAFKMGLIDELPTDSIPEEGGKQKNQETPEPGQSTSTTDEQQQPDETGTTQDPVTSVFGQGMGSGNNSSNAGSGTGMGQGAGSGYGDPTDPTIDHDDRSATTPTGRTTLAQVYEWGVTQAMLEKEFKVKFDKLGITDETILKEFADTAGIKMYDLKAFITDQID